LCARSMGLHFIPQLRASELGVVSDDFELRHPDEEVQVFIQLDEPSVAEFAAATDAGRPAQRAQALAVRAQQREVLSEIGDLIVRSEEHTSELQSRENLVCRL